MTPKSARTRPPARKHGTVGDTTDVADDISVEIDPDEADLRQQFEELTRLLGGEPLPVEQAQRLLGRIHGTKDAQELTADRAEALTQIQVAESTLAALTTTPTPAIPVAEPAAAASTWASADLEHRRRLARLAVAASVELRQAEAALARTAQPEAELLAAVEAAQADEERARRRLEPARRRTIGALISGTGMVIVIATVGWPAWAYLIPAQLVLLVAADLRVTGAEATKAKVRLADHVAAAGSDAIFDLEAGQRELAAWQEANARRDDAQRRHDDAWAAWETTAPAQDPGGQEGGVAALEPSWARPPVPDPATERARIMAETLIEDATRELAMIAEAEHELALRLRAERSLAWHEAKAALGV